MLHVVVYVASCVVSGGTAGVAASKFVQAETRSCDLVLLVDVNLDEKLRWSGKKPDMLRLCRFYLSRRLSQAKRTTRNTQAVFFSFPTF